jgi:hypothetical protein
MFTGLEALLGLSPAEITQATVFDALLQDKRPIDEGFVATIEESFVAYRVSTDTVSRFLSDLASYLGSNHFSPETVPYILAILGMVSLKKKLFKDTAWRSNLTDFESIVFKCFSLILQNANPENLHIDYLSEHFRDLCAESSIFYIKSIVGGNFRDRHYYSDRVIRTSAHIFFMFQLGVHLIRGDSQKRQFCEDFIPLLCETGVKWIQRGSTMEGWLSNLFDRIPDGLALRIQLLNGLLDLVQPRDRNYSFAFTIAYQFLRFSDRNDEVFAAVFEKIN